LLIRSWRFNIFVAGAVNGFLSFSSFGGVCSYSFVAFMGVFNNFSCLLSSELFFPKNASTGSASLIYFVGTFILTLV
jgi:hypothetical protein